MNTIWVLVTERSRARLFELETPTAPLRELKDWADTGARLQNRMYETDEAPGRTFDSMGGQRHAMEPRTDPKHKEADRFAAELVGHLHDAHTEERFTRLILVASPEMIGRLRQHMDDTLARTIVAEVEKSLVKRSLDTIRSHLPSPPVYPERESRLW